MTPRFVYVLSASLLCLASAPAIASPAASTKVDDNEERGKAERMICRTEIETGSRTNAKRRCLTAAQWQQMRWDNRQAIERAQTQLRARDGG